MGWRRMRHGVRSVLNVWMKEHGKGRKLHVVVSAFDGFCMYSSRFVGDDMMDAGVDGALHEVGDTKTQLQTNNMYSHIELQKPYKETTSTYRIISLPPQVLRKSLGCMPASGWINLHLNMADG